MLINAQELKYCELHFKDSVQGLTARFPLTLMEGMRLNHSALLSDLTPEDIS